MPARGHVLPLGKGRIVKKAEANKPFKVTILSIGTRMVEAVHAARAVEMKHSDVSVTVADARFMKPLGNPNPNPNPNSDPRLLT
jgi:deoxyxylulose-5-phosphate synthase